MNLLQGSFLLLYSILSAFTLASWIPRPILTLPTNATDLIQSLGTQSSRLNLTLPIPNNLTHSTSPRLPSTDPYYIRHGPEWTLKLFSFGHSFIDRDAVKDVLNQATHEADMHDLFRRLSLDQVRYLHWHSRGADGDIYFDCDADQHMQWWELLMVGSKLERFFNEYDAVTFSWELDTAQAERTGFGVLEL